MTQARCAAEFRSRSTGKIRRCSRQAGANGFCEKHRSVAEWAERLNAEASASLRRVAEGDPDDEERDALKEQDDLWRVWKP